MSSFSSEYSFKRRPRQEDSMHSFASSKGSSKNYKSHRSRSRFMSKRSHNSSSTRQHSMRSKTRSKATRGGQASQSVLVVDPFDETIRNPVSLNKSHKDHNDTHMTVNTSKDKSMTSVNSGKASPTMSEVSEAISVNVGGSSLRVDSSTMGSSVAQMVAQNQRMNSARTGGSSPSTYVSEEEFLFQSPAAGFQDESAVSIGETQSVVGEARDFDDEFADEHDESSSAKEKELTPLQEKQLMEQDFVINLSETPTTFLFETIDASVPNDATFHEQVEEKNKAYFNLKQKKVQSKDNYNQRDMQTISMFTKNKYSDIPRQDTSEQSVSVSAWQIFDEYEAMREMEEREREEQEQLTMKQDDEDDDEDEEDDAEVEVADNASVKSANSKTTEKSSIFKLPKFKQSLMIMERLLVQNSMIDKQEEYKNFILGKEPKREEEEPEEEKAEDEMPQSKAGDLELLWNYSCDLTKDQNVNCMAWNSKNEDMLAAGYGNIDFVGEKKGAISIWMLKNPSFPERYIPVENRGVSAIDFSESNPSLLSVGFNDGTVAIYDIRKRDTAPVLETSKHHTGTVWDLQWVDRGKDLGERLHSVGVDGRVNCWSIKKGLECQQIMRLKRHGNGEGVLSRESGGMCIDFDPNDSNLYIVGTEDGTIHKCSCSYNEQYLQSYEGHSGPVYRIRWNPFDIDSFISCSADWTIRVWKAGRRTNTVEAGGGPSNGDLKIEPYQNKEEKRSCVITDVEWSPYTRNVFASTSITGDVEVWDLNHNSMKPRFSKSNPDVQYNCLLYGNNSPSILVGDNHGNIEVLKPSGSL